MVKSTVLRSVRPWLSSPRRRSIGVNYMDIQLARVEPMNRESLGLPMGGSSNETEFTLPEEVVGGAFYGDFLQNFEGEFLPINNQEIPLALVSGSRDGVSIPEEIQSSYELIQNPPNALITIERANHYGITNQDNLRDPIRPTLEQDIANETIARWTSLFLRANVLGDSDAAVLLNNTGFDENVSIISQNQSVPESSPNIGILAIGIIALSLIKSRITN